MVFPSADASDAGGEPPADPGAAGAKIATSHTHLIPDGIYVSETVTRFLVERSKAEQEAG